MEENDQSTKASIPFRHSAGFGKRIEFYIIGKMLKEGLDVYIPLVDDFGIDAVIRKPDGTFIEVQIKARSEDISADHAALFAAITHEPRKNYYFVFYSAILDTMWIMTSEEFLNESNMNKNGKNKDKHTIWLNGRKEGKARPKPKFDKYVSTDFGIFK
jgi:hypothetical protein